MYMSILLDQKNVLRLIFNFPYEKKNHINRMITKLNIKIRFLYLKSMYINIGNPAFTGNGYVHIRTHN